MTERICLKFPQVQQVPWIDTTQENMMNFQPLRNQISSLTSGFTMAQRLYLAASSIAATGSIAATWLILFIGASAASGQNLSQPAALANQRQALESTEDAIAILSGDFSLHGSQAQQKLVVVSTKANSIGATLVPSEVTFESGDLSIVKIVTPYAIAVGSGTTWVSAKIADGRNTKVTVTVDPFEEVPQWNFRNEVQAIFARSGCNSGACHGSLAGKGGFRLSLRGYDAAADHFAITKQNRGRRIEMGDPGRSLLLAKPTGAMPHKGGIRFNTDSRDYQILSQWITNGGQAPSETDPLLDRISVSPANSLLQPGDRSDILVNAHYNDGRVVDVTHWAQFSSTDEAVASVNADGQISVRGSGEGAILVWFGSKVSLARMTVPYSNQIDEANFLNAPRRNFIDDLTLSQLQTLHLEPSPRCDDATFLRRATLDTIGRLPNTEESTEYFADDQSVRRDRLIEKLLASDPFVDYWTYKWSDMLLVNGTRLRPDAVKAYYHWIRNSVAQRQPWDQMVREIITAKGGSTENGATNFYALHQTPEDMTENASQAFLGLSIGCARCHNHPLEKWTNDQYYAMANMFSRVRAKGWGGESRNGDGVRTLYVVEAGELIQPNQGRPQPPAPLDSPALAFDDPNDRRETLAQWLVNADNPYFSRAITNRVWANFFGQGLVQQVDDLRLSNPAANEPLLDAAADYLVDTKFDLTALMRTILQSETYQRSSIPLPNNKDEAKYLSRYYPKRLMAEVLLDSIDQVLHTTTKFDEIAFPGADKQKTNFYPEGTRAIQLYDSAVSSYFLQTFGRNSREITCECERSDEPSMVQVLHLSNGETLNPKLTAKDNLIQQALTAKMSDADFVQKLFQQALMREPTARELASLTSLMNEYGDDRSTALQDVAWSVLTSAEFTFNH